MAVKKKSGSLSHDERQYIIDNAGSMSSEDIAANIGKTVKIVDKEIKNRVSLPTAENNTIRWHLKKMPEWQMLKQQFTSDELNLIESKYVKYVEQMESNLTATEESQVLNMIKIEILMDRNLRGGLEALESIKVYTKTKEAIIDSVNGEFALLDKEERNRLQDCENQITMLRQSHTSRDSQLMALQKELNGLHTRLKTSRDQRVDKIIDTKKSFGAYVKDLLDFKSQEKESRFIELMDKAAQKEEERLMMAHKYADGSYDNPMLTADILDKLDRLESDEEDTNE